MSDDENPVATLTNKLAYDVDIYNVTSDDSPKPLLKYELLATLKSGATAQTFQTKESSSQFQAMRTGKIEALNNNYYRQFPVAVMSIDPFGTDVFTLNSPVQQGAKNELDPAAMERSFKFIKYISANPTTKLATDFMAAIVDQKTKDPVDTFFKATASFNMCSEASFNAVANWQYYFVSAWQGTYYLYSPGTPAANGSKAVPPALVATLVITSDDKSTPAKLTMADSPDQSVEITMVGDGTMQDSKPGDDAVTVSLRPNWVNVTNTSTKDDKTTTQYVIGVVVTGTINGNSVAGNNRKLPAIDPDASAKTQECQDKSNSFSVDTFFKIAGLLTSMGMLLVMVIQHRAATAKKVAEAREQANDEDDANRREDSVRASDRAADGPAEQAQVRDVNLAAPNVEGAYATVAQAQEIQSKLDLVSEEIARLRQVIAEAPPNQAVQKATSDVVKTQNDLRDAADPGKDVQAREVNLQSSRTNISNANTELSNELANVNSNLGTEMKTVVKETTKAIEAEKAEIKSQEDAKTEQDKELKKDSTDPVDEDVFDNDQGSEEGPVDGPG